LEKAPPEKRITITGTVRAETGQPLRGTNVSLSPVASTGSGGREPQKDTITDADGHFTFNGLAPNYYHIRASKRGLEADGTLLSPPKEAADRTIAVFDLILCKPKKIVFDFVYQPDGSRDFTRGNLKPKTVEWSPHSGRMVFKEGNSTWDTQTPDLCLFAKRENLFFDNFVYVTNGNGVYDAGEVPFDSVVEAKDGNHYRNRNNGANGEHELPVKKNHVYVVRTYTGEYAKLIVRDIITIEPQVSTEENRDMEIERLEKETTEKILCEPFDEKLYPPEFLEIVKQIEEQLKNDNGGGVSPPVKQSRNL